MKKWIHAIYSENMVFFKIGKAYWEGVKKMILGGIVQCFLKIGVFFHIPWTNVIWHGFTKWRPRDSALFCFFCFSMDKIKASQIENWQLLFPTNPPLFLLHFLGLDFFFHLLDNSLIIFPICEVLDKFGKCFSHLWGFAIFW